MRTAAWGLLLGLFPLLAGASSVPAQPAEYLPIQSPLYEDIEALAARGYLRSLPTYSRPLARVDLAEALLDARRRSPEAEPDLHVRRLERELWRELEEIADTLSAPHETGPLLDLGQREQRFRVSLAGHLRGDFDETREAAHYRLRDESSVSARASLQLWPAVGAFEELGITRIRGQREFIDAIALHTDLEATVLRGELTARVSRLTAALGYDAQRWGPGARGTLLLSGAQGPMEFFSLQGSTRGRVSVAGTALTAVISAADDQYLAAHRIEIGAPRLVIGLAEAARYRSDGVDLLYASGLLPYTIIERIRIREASNDSLRRTERANVMASADVSFRAWPGLTAYGELLVDDFATESADMPNRIAYQLGLRSERPYGSHFVHLLGEYTRVRNFTYSVEYGEDYIYRGRSLGFVLGPDVENVFVEAAFDLSAAWQLRWSGDFTNRGEGRLGIPWVAAQGPVSTAGLSGIVEERREVWGDARWFPRDNVDVSAGLGYRRLRNENNAAGADRNAWLARVAADLRY